MYLTFNLDDIDRNSIIFGEKKRNNIIEYGDYINIIYAKEYFTLNNIVARLHFKNISFEPYFNKFKSSFQYEKNKDVVEKLLLLEKDILSRYSTKKKHIYSLVEQLSKNSFKILLLKDTNIKTNKIYRNVNISIKFSGIWEKSNTIGVIHKFILDCNN